MIHDRELVAALEFKSHVGPSFGNNFNNRAEEALGTAADFWTAFREGAFGKTPRPFLGWLMLLEDAPESRCAVKESSPNFDILPEFKGSSYAARYKILCSKLVKENLYTTATLLVSPRAAASNGKYREMDETTGCRTFVATLAGHIAAVAARTSSPRAR